MKVNTVLLSLFIATFCIVFTTAQIPVECMKYNFPKEFVPLPRLAKCLRTVKISKADATEILSTLSILLENYSFRDLAKDSPSQPPFVHIQNDIFAQINEIGKNLTDVAWDFYTEIQKKVTAPLQDPHTLFIKPQCFTALIAQPLKLEAFMGTDGKMKIRNAGMNTYGYLYGRNLWNIDYLNYMQVITAIDGQDPLQVIANYSKEIATYSKDPSVNFNYALFEDFTLRASPSNFAMPKNLNMTFSYANGRNESFAWGSLFVGDFNSCNVAPVQNKREEVSIPLEEVLHPVPKIIQLKEELKRQLLDPVVQPMYAPTTTKVSVLDSNTIVVKVPTFMEQNIWEAIEDQIEALGVNPGQVIIDVRGNGGGIVCEGFHLLKYFAQPSPPLIYDYIHSKMNDAFVNFFSSNPNPNFEKLIWNKNAWTKPGTDQTFDEWYGPRTLNRGGSTSNYTALLEFGERDCTQFKEPISTSYDKIIILSDGRCGSTCALFTSLLQMKHPNVRVVTSGGIPDQKQMAFSTFPGGMVIQDKQYFAISKLAQLNQFPQNWPTGVSLTFNMAEAYMNGNSTIPNEFVFLPADFRLLDWPHPDSSSGSLQLYKEAAIFFTDKSWPAAPNRTATVPRTRRSTYTAASWTKTGTKNGVEVIAPILAFSVLLVASLL